MLESVPVPQQLGRGAIIGPHQVVPPLLLDAPLVVVDQAVFDRPDATVAELHALWMSRQPVVVRLELDASTLKSALTETDDRAPWELGPAFLFARQRLHFLVWNNNVDMRSGTDIWWWTRKAVALGATECTDGTGDVVLADGQAVYCDGGPLSTYFHADALVIPYSAIEVGQLRVAEARASASVLAADQSEAVHHVSGPARVIAPAGSGKTRVLTERLRHLLADCNVAPNTVLAVAYNTRAAGELSERTVGINTHIRTLNSLALAIVNGTGPFERSYLEGQPRAMVDEREVRNILQRMVDLPRKMNTDPLAAWVEALSLARLGLKSPRAVEDASGDLAGFADVFKKFRYYLGDNSLLDFDEQIYRAIEILLQDPKVRIVAQRACRTLLVDEFQDLTPAHVLMLRLLASPALNVFGVGDDDQVIYGYAGADPRYLVEFDSWFPGATHHALEVNYRCPPAVVNAAANMLTRNAVRVGKNIHSGPGRESLKDDLVVQKSASATMATTAVDIVSNWQTEGARPAQIALLARVNVALLPAQVLLSESGIAHTAPVNASLLDRTGIRTALAYLRIASDTQNIRTSDVMETVRRPSRKIARNVVDLMVKGRRTSLTDLRRLAAGLTGNDGARVDHYVEDIQAVARAVAKGDTAAALESIRSEVGLGEALEVLDGSRKEADRSTHGDDLAAITAVAHLHPNVRTFEAWLREVLNRASDSDGVELSTVHRVKGREWDHVIVYDASEGLMPHRLNTDRAEERRILHVALTRGRKNVVVLSDMKQPSTFLEEFDAPGEPEILVPIIREVLSTPTKKVKLAPELGMSLTVPGGTQGEIIEVTETGVIVAMGKVRTTVAFGASVSHQGKILELGKPRNEAAEKVVEALKAWRAGVAASAKIPAYTVLWDAHLEDIAAAAPRSLGPLAQCNGIGPAKLERWGDEILATIEGALAGDPAVNRAGDPAVDRAGDPAANLA